MRLLRTLPAPRLLILIAAAVAVVTGGAAIAIAASSSEGTKPAPKPLADAIHDALTAPQPAGVTARVTFTNNLLPSGALFGNAGSALLSGASGRLWLTNEGRGRIELQSDAGDVQIVWNKTAVSVYDASSNTVYKLALPATNESKQGTAPSPPTVAEISDFLTKLAQHLDVAGATPMTVAGRPAYGVSLSPKEIGSLLGSVRLAWDAQQGAPLSAGVYAKGSSAPALKLSVTHIAYGSVPSSAVDLAPPVGAKVVDLGTLTGRSGSERAKPKPVTGLDAVRAGATFDVVAPDAIGGLQRTNALLVGKRVLVVYGKGPGAIVVAERKADSARPGGGPLKALPPVSLGGVTGHELTTQLGTLIAWQRGGVTYVLAGSVPSATAETAAREVK